MATEPSSSVEISSAESDAARRSMHPLLALAFIFVLGMGCIGLMENLPWISAYLFSPRRTPEVDVGGTFVRPGAQPGMIDGVMYNYVAPADRRLRLTNGYVQLKLGMTREEVRSVLGDPDRVYEGHTKSVPSTFTGWTYQYDLWERPLDPGKGDASPIQVYFDVHHKLEWASPPRGVPDLHKIGGIGAK